MLSRSVYERQLAHALARHIGYTTGAFSLDRLADVSGLFPKASAYSFELVKHIQDRPLGSKPLTEGYATEVVNFCTALGLLERLETSGNAKLARFRLSSEALALRAATALEITELRRLVLTALLVENDADGYGLLLDLLDVGMTIKEREGQGLADRYLAQTKLFREERWQWLQRVFPQRVLQRRIAEQIYWLRVPKQGEVVILEPKSDFGRHHSTPRKGWAESLAHASAHTHELTQGGKELLSRLRRDAPRYRWVAPPKATFEALKIPAALVPRTPHGPAWDLLRPHSLESDQIPEPLVHEVARFMREAYPHLKLHHANQAPTAPVGMFVYVKERELGRRLSRRALLELVFREYASYFAPMSSRTEKLAFYLLRKEA
jgi:hypothetical protein